MMMHTMNEMMNGGMGLMMSGMFLSMALWILLLAVLTWGLLTWLNRGWGRLQPMPDTAQSPYSYHSYEQGYHPAQPMPRSSREGERYDRSAQPKQEFDQPSVLYLQEQEMPPQS